MSAPNVETVYELSPLQQGILLHTLAAPHSGTYFEQITWTARGRFDTPRFVDAWKRTVARHAVLRTSFHSQGLDKPLQVVHRQVELPVNQEDWRGLAADEHDAKIDAYLSADRRRGFDLGEAPLVRLAVLQLADDSWQIVLSFHHLLLDGWSVALLAREVALVYDAIGRGEKPRLDAIRPYREYIAWLQRQDLSEAEVFWREALAGFTAPTSIGVLPSTEIRTGGDDDDAAHEEHLSPEATEALRQFARRERITLNTVVQGAWALLLSRYSGQADVLFGSVTSGRPTDLGGANAMVGMFINTVPMRVPVPRGQTVGAWLRALQTSQLRSRQYEHTPLVAIQGWSEVPRSQPLFSSIVAFENYPADRAQAAAKGDFAVSGIRVFEKTNFPLNLVVKPGDRLGVRLLANRRQFDAATSVRMLGHFTQLLDEIAADASRPLSALSLLTADERQQILHGWNQTDRDYPRTPVHEVFERQARRDPGAVAVVFGETRLTYGELEVRANRLAHRLRRLGVGAGTLVGVCVDRSEQLIVSLLGILKAGGAYVPLDAAYPAKRLEFMFADAALTVLVTQEASLGRLRGLPDSVVCVDLDDPSLDGEPMDPPVSGATLDDLAYVTYTSGSTGVPKGVEVRHRGVLRLLFGADYVRYGADTKILQLAPVAFDASTFEVWGALLHGGCCVVYPEGVPTTAEIGELIARHRVTTLFLTTALFNKIVDERPRTFAPLRQLLTGGEAMSVAHVRKAYAALDTTGLIHVYGPTETTTFATWYPIPRAIPAEQHTMPIGYPIGNTRAYVVDGMDPLPVGIPGELLLGGDGLARGYLHRPELTAERFVPDPFSGREGARLYRTGDLVRLLPDGSIDFLGRIDSQVKIRGFRIELGEIDAALISYASIAQAVTVVVDEDGEKRLASYVVPEVARDELRWDDLRTFLRDRLPEYMVPSRFVALEAIPLNANGKVDKAALPKATAERQVEEQYVAPRGEMERSLAALWRDVLRVETVGVRDNFFDLGGHSLLLVQLHGKIVDLIGRSIPLMELFEYPTVEALAARLAPQESVAGEAAEPRPRRRLRAADPGEAVAIVGMAGRFPGAPDVGTFWENLRGGVESIRFFSDDELRRAGIDDRQLSDPRYVKARGVLDGADLFDAAFFGYSPREADLIDPQQRVFLECASEALDDAGYDPDRYDGPIGVYAGANLNTYLLYVLAHPSVAPSIGGLQALIASGSDFLPTRVSYKLNLRGPSVNVQTACSTSLVAVHQACRSLLDNECDLALAGGVSVGAPLLRGHVYQEGGITSRDGHCRAFDADSSGTVGGNGAGVVVLKRLSDATRDGDTIHAVILGTAINNDGSGKVGYTAPGLEGQSEVIALAQASAGVEPSAISYVEAHGTGTALGDPVEVTALRRVFDRHAGVGTCAIGTVKTNVGHLDAAAGVAGLIKTVLALEHRELPPSLHFVRPNPEIPFDGSSFYVNASLTPWKSVGQPRRAGVSSFGIGGTNAHVIVEEAPAAPAAGASRAWQVLVVSAKTRSALDAATRRLAAHLAAAPDAALPEAAYTLQVGRRQFAHRRMVVSGSRAEAVAALTQPGQAGGATAVAEGGARSVVFLCSGQGAQYAGMAAGLYRDEPAFRAEVDACCEELIALGEPDLRPLLFADLDAAASGDVLRQTAVTQPALFVIEYALARLWMQWGVRPAALVGHSVGEYVAACLAGVFTRADALRLVALRGRLMQGLPAGAMLAVPLAEAEVTPLLPAGVSLAASNGPRLCVVAGPADAIAAVEATLAARGVAGQRLQTSHAFHSAMMDPILEAFEAAVAQVAPVAPQVPFISNVTGTWMTAAEATSAAYWRRHLRAPVRFAAGMQTLFGEPGRVLLEVGPGRTLATLARQNGAAAAGAVVLTSLRHAQETTPDQAALLQALGGLWLAGVAVDWPAFSAHEQRRRVPLPTYPFERQRYWIDPPRAAAKSASPQRALVKAADVGSWFYEPRWTRASRPVEAGAEGTWLVFADDGGVSDRLVDRLRRDGRRVVSVRAGDRFARIDQDTYTIDPAEPQEYDTLLAHAGESGRVGRIAHLWSMGPARRRRAQDIDDFAASQTAGFYSVLSLAQALGRRDLSGPVDLFVVGDRFHRIGDGDDVAPEKSTVLGLSLVIPQENPAIRCGTVDIAWEPGASPDVIERLYEELSSAPSGHAVAYRGQERWIQSYSPVSVPQAAGDSWLRDDATCLITGGLGSVGLAIAEHMARSKRVRLVLVNRTGLPAAEERQPWLDSHAADDRVSRRIAAVRRLEALGAEVLVLAADVASLEEMRDAVTTARARFGPIHGVIHAAGAMDGAGLAGFQSLGRDGGDAQFRPKVRGAEVLERVLAGGDLDFCLATSSLSSVLGGLSFGAYAAANRFLDGLAERSRAAGRLRWTSVNLDGWRFGEFDTKNALVDLAMTPSEGVESLVRILGSGSLARAVVSTGDLEIRLDRYVRRLSTAEAVIPAAGANVSLSRYARPEIETAYAVPLDEIQERVAEVWQELLGIDRIGRNDNFFDLGGHSLLLVQAQGKIAAKLGRELSVAQLFQFPTIAALAEHLGGAGRPAERPQVSEREPGAAADGIAIVGMSCRFPGAPDAETFWTNLRDGVESIETLTDDAILRQGVDAALLNHPNFVKAASAIDGIDLFDAPFFGYSPREAELIDPQHRLFLECAWEALERAGCDPRRYAGLIGVFAGAGMNRYLDNIVSHPEIIQSVGMLQAAMGNKSDYLPTRVSYKLNLRGPSVNVQTACSTSLVAIHQACRSLADGECDVALAGGVSVSVPGRTGYVYVEDSILSPDGHCRPFDAKAQGTIMASGVGVVMLKRLGDAIADGDVVHAVIRGTAINNDGSGKVGYTAPSVDGQAAVIARAQAAAGVEADQITYVEAHGTGTALGDPVEVAALTQAFGSGSPGTCAIGTLKSNIGHLDAAAGVAGIIKTALALEHRQLPPSLHFEAPNPKIDFGATPFYVNTDLKAWPPVGGRRLAGVSSFGIGGTNAHAVLEEAPALEPSGPSRDAQILLLSARSRAALDDATSRLAVHLERDGAASLADVAYTLKVGRQEFEHRRAVVCRDVNEAVAALSGRDAGRRWTGEASAHSVPLAFMFPGQGAQHPGMARGLYGSEPLFRSIVDDCAAHLQPHLGFDLREVLYIDGPAEAAASDRLKQTAAAQPALFVIEFALASLWQSWGIEPRAMIGHSVGELVAACLAGVFDLEDALDIVAARGRLMQQMPSGAMFGVALSEERARALLCDDVWIAAINGPSLCVLSTPADRAEALDERLQREGVAAKRLETSHAFHSPMMDPIVAEFVALVAAKPRRAPRIPFVSNVTGTWIEDTEAQDPAYWGRHLRQAVRFSDGLNVLLEDARRVVLEVGPGRTLSGLARQQPACGRERLVLSSLPHHRWEEDGAAVAAALGQLWTIGAPVDWSGFYQGQRRRRVVLPTYPFDRKRYWIDPKPASVASAPQIAARSELADWFYVPSWKRAVTPRAAGAAASGRWLIFADDAGIAEQVVANLRETVHDVVVVEAGTSFARHGADRYAIAPGDRDDYRRLLETLKQENRWPEVIGHFWGATPAEDPQADPADGAARGFYSLLFLTQAIGDADVSDPVRLAVVTTGLHVVSGEESITPSKATALGPVRVIPREYPQIACRAVDLVASEWASADPRRIAALVAELARADRSGDVVALRRGHRWVPTAEPVRLEPAGGAPPARLRNGGVYLVTGGTGGIGLTLAGYLARTVAAKLVLTSRTGLPPRGEWDGYLESHEASDRIAGQMQSVIGLEQAGADVMVAAVDVANEGEMRTLVADVRRRFGPIDGVIHAAGVAGGGIIQLKDPQAAARVLAPKVAGTEALAHALAGEPLEFMVLCSSMTSLVGGGGQVDYCAANAYLDAFAQAYSQRTGAFAVAINWDAWRDVGMAVETAVAGDQHRSALLERAIAPAEGAEAFARILGGGPAPQIAVCTTPFPALVQKTGPEKGSDQEAAGAAQSVGSTRYDRPDLQTAYAAPENEIEAKVAEIWQELLAIDRIGRNDGFFELGGHSLLATQLVSRIRQCFGVNVGLDGVFEAGSVAGLSLRVMERMLDGEGGGGLEPLLTELQELSAEDIERELRENATR